MSGRVANMLGVRLSASGSRSGSLTGVRALRSLCIRILETNSSFSLGLGLGLGHVKIGISVSLVRGCLGGDLVSAARLVFTCVGRCHLLRTRSHFTGYQDALRAVGGLTDVVVSNPLRHSFRRVLRHCLASASISIPQPMDVQAVNWRRNARRHVAVPDDRIAAVFVDVYCVLYMGDKPACWADRRQ